MGGESRRRLPEHTTTSTFNLPNPHPSICILVVASPFEPVRTVAAACVRCHSAPALKRSRALSSGSTSQSFGRLMLSRRVLMARCEALLVCY